MTTTEKYNCRCLAAALRFYGVSDVVVSPGSRNAPLVVAFARSEGLRCHVVIDERSAAFIALGMAIKSQSPVAVCCTSGSAPLNFGPAFAEAFYRHIPLIAITADRPEEWIDQDDSQTIRQHGCLAAVAKGCFDLPVCRGDEELRRLIRRRTADALMLASSGIKGPVQINVRIDEPINALAEAASAEFSFPCLLNKMGSIDTEALAQDVAGASGVLVIAGFMPPQSRLSTLLSALPDNVAILCEAQSNLHGDFVHNIDATLSAMSAHEKDKLLHPDVVITLGGSLLSRMIKAELRSRPGIRHWCIGQADHCIDPLLHLEKRIDCDAVAFFESLAVSLRKFRISSDYKHNWLAASDAGHKRTSSFLATSPWSDFAAMGQLAASLPADCDLHLSNGTAVRYAQLFPCKVSRVECNRGVSGIDGCTSTAIGSAMSGNSLTMLISGDMCAQYDLGALATTGIPANFRLAVLNNSGGGIFRFINATRDLPEMPHFLAADVRLPLRQLADGFGFDYFEATDAHTLACVLPRFYAGNGRPAILNIITPAEESASTIRKYFSNI